MDPGSDPEVQELLKGSILPGEIEVQGGNTFMGCPVPTLVRTLRWWNPSRTGTLILGLLALFGCTRESSRVAEDTASVDLTDRVAAYDDTSLALPRLVYADGAITLNDRCPVRKAKLNRRLPAMMVNGHPVGFC